MNGNGGQEISTVLSDCLLAFSAFYAAWHLYSINICSTIAFVIIGCAGVAGAARFAGCHWPANLQYIHNTLFWAINAVSIPLIAVSYLSQVEYQGVAAGLLLIILAVLVLKKMANLQASVMNTITWMVIFLSSAALLFSCLVVKFSLYGLIGATLYATVACIPCEGSFGPIPRVDVQHYLRAVGNLALLFGLVKAKVVW